jgi:hypothetical protein
MIQYFYSKAAEIIRMFRLSNVNISVDSFLEWCKNRSTTNSSFALQYQQIFTYYFALHLHHKGIRYNNDDWIRAGDTVFAPLWFASKHPNYAKFQILARIDESLLSTSVRNFIDVYSVFSRSKTVGKYQGLDAYLEEIHKEATKFLPSNPTEEHWKQAFINLQYYLKLDNSIKRITEKKINYSMKRRKYPITDIIYHRLMSHYDQDEDGILKGTNGALDSEEVTPGIENFIDATSIYRNKYISDMINSKNRVLPVKSEYVYLSKEEHNKNEQKKLNSISGLASRISDLFKQYEETMRGLKSDNPSRTKWDVYKKHQSTITSFTKESKVQKNIYLQKAVIDIQKALDQIKMPIKIRIKPIVIN